MSFFLLAATVFVGLHTGIMLALSALATWRRQKTPPPLAALPRLAIIVAARDEETDLPRCLEALLAQDYPADRFDIYIADDHSTDNTAEVIRRFQDLSKDGAGPTVLYVPVPDTVGSLVGKANAIHAAVNVSDQEILVITDADCAPPSDWARKPRGLFC